MPHKQKIAWLYVLSALFVAVSLYLVVEKNNYLGFALPAVIGILLLYVFSLDVVMFIIAFLTPLSINLEILDTGFAISLPIEVFLIGVMVLFFAKLVYERHYDLRIARHPIAIVIYLMFVWMLVTTITSELPIVSVKYMISRMWFIVPSFFVCSILFKKAKNINTFVWLYIGGLIIVIIYTTINHALNSFSGDSAHWVMTPFYNDHTAYGAALAIYLVMIVSYLSMPRLNKTRRVLVVVALCLFVMATILSFCRAAWLSLIAALCVWVCVILKIKFRLIATTFAILVGLFFAFQHQIIDVLEKNDQDASGNLVENIQSISNISTDASNLERINRWSSALRLFRERPMFGWGPGTYQFVYAPFQMSREKTIISTNSGDGGNAHSEYIGPLAEMGVVGSLLVVALVIVSIYKGLATYKRAKNKESRILALGATLAIVSYFVHGILNNFLDTDKLAVPIWSCLAIIAAIDTYHAEKENFTDET